MVRTMSNVRPRRRRSASSIIAAAAKLGKDVKIEYGDNGEIKCLTTITPGTPEAAEANNPWNQVLSDASEQKRPS
jgi:hypothetical protein